VTEAAVTEAALPSLYRTRTGLRENRRPRGRLSPCRRRHLRRGLPQPPASPDHPGTPAHPDEPGRHRPDRIPGSGTACRRMPADCRTALIERRPARPRPAPGRCAAGPRTSCARLLHHMSAVPMPSPMSPAWSPRRGGTGRYGPPAPYRWWTGAARVAVTGPGAGPCRAGGSTRSHGPTAGPVTAEPHRTGRSPNRGIPVPTGAKRGWPARWCPGGPSIGGVDGGGTEVGCVSRSGAAR
jgi:hypothetical protein